MSVAWSSWQWPWYGWQWSGAVGSYPDQEFHDDGVALGGGHVQGRAVHLGPGVTAHPGSQQHVRRGVVAVLGREVQGGRPQLKDQRSHHQAAAAALSFLHCITSNIN